MCWLIKYRAIPQIITLLIVLPLLLSLSVQSEVPSKYECERLQTIIAKSCIKGVELMNDYLATRSLIYFEQARDAFQYADSLISSLHVCCTATEDVSVLQNLRDASKMMAQLKMSELNRRNTVAPLLVILEMTEHAAQKIINNLEIHIPNDNQHVRQGQHLFVKVSALNVRSGPGTNFNVLKTLKMGQKVLVYEIRGNWIKIQHYPFPGYVHKAYLEDADENRKRMRRVKETAQKILNQDIFTEILVAIDRKALDELLTAFKIKNTTLAAKLFLSGRLFTIPVDTRILVLEEYDSETKIRILEGEDTGTVGWIIREWIR